jgi:hypothetical protein
VATYGGETNGGPQMSSINGVTVDAGGRMWAIDTDNYTWVLDAQGRLIAQLGPEYGEAGFVFPAFLVLTPDGRLYFPDAAPGANRVVEVKVDPPLWPPP